MQPLGGEHMGLEEFVQRLQCSCSGADLVGQRRQAQRHAFPGIALGLPVQRLVLAELLEQHHCEQVRSLAA